eukprot:305909_1
MENESQLVYIKPITWTCNVLALIGVTLLTLHFVRKSRQGKAAKINKLVTGTAYCMFISTNISLVCKVFMPYISNCLIAQIITVALYTIMRGSYYLFLCYRLELAFGDSMHARVNKKAMRIFRWLVFITTIGIGVWNIATVYTSVEINVPPWGLYCKWITDKYNVMFYAAFDFIVSGCMVYLFASKLYKVTKWFNAHRSGDTVVNDRKVVQKIRLLAALAISSIVSTWIFVVGGHTLVPFLNWIVTADYFINVLSLYLMFSFVRLRERLTVAESMECPGSKWCCWCWCCPVFKYICWTEDVRELMAKLEQEVTEQKAEVKQNEVKQTSP